MKSTPLIFLGILVGLTGSWWGVVVAPQLQLGSAPTVLAKEIGQQYPPNRPGLAQQGAEMYRSEGCNACHSQVVRPAGFGHDLLRGWGTRRTVGADYLRDTPVMLGSVRAWDLTCRTWGSGWKQGDTNIQPAMVAHQLKHLYHPRTVTPHSVMPAYPYLFVKRPAGATPSPEALKLEGAFAPEAGMEVVPTPAAQALMAYLLSLRSTVSLREAPVILPSTNEVKQATNAAPTKVASVR